MRFHRREVRQTPHIHPLSSYVAFLIIEFSAEWHLTLREPHGRLESSILIGSNSSQRLLYVAVAPHVGRDLPLLGSIALRGNLHEFGEVDIHDLIRVPPVVGAADRLIVVPHGCLLVQQSLIWTLIWKPVYRIVVHVHVIRSPVV